MYEKYGDKVRFVMVYIREAHPATGDQTAENAGVKVIEGVVYHQPKTFAERRKLAETACSFWDVKFPALVDTIDPNIDSAYNAHPNRIYLIDTDSKIAYRGVRGPMGALARPTEVALCKLLGLPEGDYVSDERRPPPRRPGAQRRPGGQRPQR
jgi:hypothetical protein